MKELEKLPVYEDPVVLKGGVIDPAIIEPIDENKTFKGPLSK